MTDYKDFAIRLSLARNRAAMSQGEIAQQVGITQTQVSRYEIGKAFPRPATLRALATALGVTPEWLVNGEGDGRQMLVKVGAPRGAFSWLTIHGDPATLDGFTELAAKEGMTPDRFLAKLVAEHMTKLQAKDGAGPVEDSDLAQLSKRIRALEARVGTGDDAEPKA
ncbi:helix-turn-helix domain-containing protein [Acidovorax sp. NCPPB 3576]|uniref:helix-turn-helix domain-containing protein n=1 Tax=Acidovorax sp. NCPPB 3576 TaxID=2940488 RepID=UPI00234B6883|nr:helix-turn-helix transcriptional regulator [Acidovorax sp. NCPPB 3576]WCM88815.1 helix-turn-helix transcriptional regulator [Acidovorax sp. NCPPB 3576]